MFGLRRTGAEPQRVIDLQLRFVLAEGRPALRNRKLYVAEDCS